MATNKKEIGDILSTDDTLPLSSTFAPTVTAASGGSKFTLSVASADAKRGAWIYDNTNAKLYKMSDVAYDGLSGWIEGTFEDTLSAATVKIITKEDAAIIQMSISANQGSASNVDGSVLTQDQTNSYSPPEGNAEVGNRFVEPKIVQGSTAGAVAWTITKF